MRTLRTITPALLLTLSLSAAACTSAGNGRDPASASPSLEVEPGAYVYRRPGIEATFELRGDAGTLVVLNETGFPLDDPGVYLLDARDGSRVEAEVTDPASVPDGRTRGFEVEVPDAPEAKHVGLVVLMVGDDDFGAFAPARDQA